MESWYNRNARVRVLNIGDMVTILGPSLKHSMSTERQGPFPVVKVVTPVTYLVKLGVGRKPIRLFHINRLAKYHSPVAANLYVEIQSAGEVEATEHIATWDGTRDQTLDLNHNIDPQLNEEQRRQLNDI